MQEISETHKDICRLDTIGFSVNGRLLLCLKISSSPNGEINKPKFFYSAAMHGNELTGAIMLLRLIDSLVTNPDNTVNLPHFPVVYICPFANPDGTWVGGNNKPYAAVRYNANYVDLNRNYPDIRNGRNTDGENRQVETEAFIEYQMKEKFNLSCNLHTGSEVFNYPWDSYISERNKHADDDWFKTLGNDFITELNDESGKYFTDVSSNGIVEGGDWYVIHGSRQDWSTYFAHCREVTLEVSMDYIVPENTLDNYWHKLKNSLFVFFDYCNLGFNGIITDSITSKTLADVKVEMEQYDKDSSQVFSNDYGYYFRPILDGTYSVTFSKDGYYSKTYNINVTNSLEEQNVELVPINTSDNEIKNTTNISYKIYPTIAENEITIQIFGNCPQHLTYTITDMEGIVKITGRVKSCTEKINIGQLSAGSYILRLNNNNYPLSIEKFIKK